jgi:hypothetical protein
MSNFLPFMIISFNFSNHISFFTSLIILSYFWWCSIPQTKYCKLDSNNLNSGYFPFGNICGKLAGLIFSSVSFFLQIIQKFSFFLNLSLYIFLNKSISLPPVASLSFLFSETFLTGLLFNSVGFFSDLVFLLNFFRQIF